MRLPQSLAYYLSVFPRRFSLIGLAVLIGLVPTRLQAATQAVIFSPASLSFGQVVVGQTETQLVTLTNTGQNSITISAISTNNSEFSVGPVALPINLATGQSVDVSVCFGPTGTGWAGGKIKFSTSQPNSTVGFQAEGNGVTTQAVVATPTSLSFGQVSVGSSATAAVVLTNTASWKVKLSGLETQGTGFSVTAPTFPLTLGHGQSVTLSVTFAPQVAGLTGGSTLVTGAALNIPFSGTGTSATSGLLTINPTTLNFGNVTIGTTRVLSAALSASGGNVTISSATSNSAQFAVSGMSFPLTIASGQSILVSVGFTPQTSGSESSTISFVSNATDSPTSDPATGTGVAVEHSVDLTWSSAANAIGYNVYRSTVSGGPYTMINSSLDPTTTYTDTTVVSGTTYYYVATSVDANNVQSGYSNQAQAVVSSP